MSSLSKKFWPLSFHSYEAIAMRILFAGILALSVKDRFPLKFKSQDHPTGLAHLFDLTFFSDPATAAILQYIFLGGLYFYIIGGRFLPFILPVLSAIHIGLYTFYNSQGFTHHGYQIVSLVLLTQTCVALAPPISRLFGKKWPGNSAYSLDQWSIYYSQMAIAGCYVIAGVIKIYRTGGKWFWDSPNIAVQLIKTNDQMYYNFLRPEDKEALLPYANWIIENPMLARIALGSGVILELAAFMALYSRKWALALGVAIIAFHRSVGELMQLYFPFNEYMVAIFFINIPFWIVWAHRRWMGTQKI